MRYENRCDLRDRTKRFGLDVIRMFSELPKTTVAQVIGRQVLRSGTSVGANYREAYRSRSRVEFAAKIGDCLKELEETAYWIELIRKSGVLPEARLAALYDECDQLLAIMTSIAKKAKSHPS